MKINLDNARNLLNVLDDESIAKAIGLEVSQVEKLRKELGN